MPALVRDIFGGDIADAGLYRGLIGAGLVIGAIIMTIVGPAMPIPLAIMLALMGGAFWIFALAVAYVFNLGVFSGLCLLGIGAAGAGLLVTIMATIQRFVPDTRRGRVFGVSDMCTMAAIVAATGALGLPNIPNIDIYIPYLLLMTGLGLTCSAVFAGCLYRRNKSYPVTLSILWQLTRFYADFWLRVKRLGPCTVPQRGPVILAMNHTAGVDPMAIYATCTYRVVSFVVAQEYYTLPILGWFQRQVYCIPIDRTKPGKAFLSSCLRLLKGGGCLAIFPEGTWAQPGQQQPEAKSGVGLLALRTGAVVIPCHLSGTNYSYSPFKAYFTRHKMRVRYGRPVDLSAFRGREKERDVPQQASDLIMAKIRELEAEASGGEA